MTKEKIDQGGQKFCSKCRRLVIRKQGNQWLCAKHYRFGQMRITAKRHGKFVPTHQELEGMMNPENKCSDCNERMVWLAIENSKRVINLQHYRNGLIGLVCHSCNSRHSAMPGDSFCSMPKDHKQCCSCKQIKVFQEFYMRRAGFPTAACRQCMNLENKKWRESHKKHLESYSKKKNKILTF